MRSIYPTLTARVLANRDLHFDVQLLAHVLADAMQCVAATRANLLIFWQIVFDALARQLRRQRLATAFARPGDAGIRQSRIGQLGKIVVLLSWLRCGNLFSVVEHAILALLALWGETLGQRETILFFERIQAPGQFRNLRVALRDALRINCGACFELVNVCLGVSADVKMTQSSK